MIRLQKFFSFKEKKVLINSYFLANFNYCPLVWMFSSVFGSISYEDVLLWKKSSVWGKRIDQFGKKYKLNLDIPSYNQVNFGRKALTFFGLKTWNSLSYHIKSSKSLASFRTMIKFWNRENCSWKICCNFFFLFPIRLAEKVCS